MKTIEIVAYIIHLLVCLAIIIAVASWLLHVLVEHIIWRAIREMEIWGYIKRLPETTDEEKK